MTAGEFPTVSVIIPCYNAAAFVGEAIQSALDQTYPHKEVIVVDDGSTDRSLEVIKSFQGKIQFRSVPNEGGCQARNRGLRLARGELIQFHDADDLLHPQKLALQVPVAVAHRPTIVYCDYEVQSMGRSLTTSNVPHCDGLDPVVFILRRRGLSTPAPLHWKADLERVGGFRPGLACGQERDLHLRLACHGATFRRFDRSLVTVRRTTGSVSADLIRLLDQYHDIVWHAHNILKTSGRLTPDRSAALAGLLAAGGRNYLNYGLLEKSQRYFSEAAKIHPSGGVPYAYRPATRLLFHCLGPVITQRLVAWKRVFVKRVKTRLTAAPRPNYLQPQRPSQ